MRAIVWTLVNHDAKPGKIAKNSLDCALSEAFVVRIVDPQHEGSSEPTPQEIVSHGHHRATFVQIARGRRCVADANSHGRRMAVIGGQRR